MLNRRDALRAGTTLAALIATDRAFAGLHFHGTIPNQYEGSVASRARVIHTSSFTVDTANHFMMMRSAHIATENLTAIKVVFSNFTTNGGGADLGPGAASPITASVEYPAGTFTQILFSGSATGSIPDARSLFADYVSVSIPSGATFWIRLFIQNTLGVCYNSWQNSFLGEAMNLSATSISDQTMGGTITNSGSFSCPPMAILGMTTNASVVIVGNSTGVGSPGGGDTEDSSASATGFNAKVGLIARSLGSIPFINIAAGGQIAQNWATNSPARSPLIQKGSHLICEMGVNDLNGSRTSAQLIADLQAIFAFGAAFQKKYQTTITPMSTSTDAFATLVNQTARASAAERMTFNNAVRAGSVGPTGFFDIASVLESSVNSDKWIVAPTPPYTGDGIHPTPSGYLLVPAAGVISGITYP